MSDPLSANLSSSADEAWHQIEGLIEEITQLASADLSTQEFFAELLDRAVRALAAVGGAVWRREPDRQIKLAYQINFPQILLEEDTIGQQSHRQLIEQSFSNASVQAILPRSGNGNDGSSGNPTQYLLLLGGVEVDHRIEAVLEIFQRSSSSPSAQRGYEQLVDVLCEVAADFFKNRRRLDLQQRETLWTRFDRYAQRVHGSLDLGAVAYEIANEGRRLIGCDRISLLDVRGSRCRTLAVSGLETINRRSNVIRLLESLARVMTAIGEPLYYKAQTRGFAPQVEASLQAYLDESHTRSLAVIPLHEPGEELSDRSPSQSIGAPSESIGVLVIEWFGTVEEEDETLQQRLDVVCRHSYWAMRNAIEVKKIPFVAILRRIGKLSEPARGRPLVIAVTILIALISGIACLALVPAELKIEGRGELQPVVRYHVFAPSDAIVSKLHVQQHASQVSRHDVLLELIDRHLEYESTSVSGELDTALQQLRTVGIERQQLLPNQSNALEKSNELTAKEEELKVRVAGLEKQLSILQKQQNELMVHSTIDGQVLTWDIAKLLQSRPVQRGQVLMTVADTNGPWVLDMHVSDKHIGYVLSAQHERGEELKVSFILKTDPGVTHIGEVKKISMITDTDDAGQATVKVTIAIDHKKISPLRPGATVVAKIFCGQKPIGYVWLHDLIEAVRTKILY